MRRITLSALLVLTFLLAYSNNWTPIRSSKPAPAEKILVSSDIDNSTVHFLLDGFSSTEVNTDRGQAMLLSLEGSSPILKKGAPDLPKLTASLIKPNNFSFML